MVKTPFKVFIKITYTAKFPSRYAAAARLKGIRRDEEEAGSGQREAQTQWFPVARPFPDVRSAEPKGGHGISERPHPRRTGFQLCVRSAAPWAVGWKQPLRGARHPRFVVSALLSVGWT